MNTSASDPLWTVYDKQKEIRLNVRYFECVVTSLTRKNFWLEVIIAASASTGVAGIFLRFTDKIAGCRAILTSYRLIDHELAVLVDQIRNDEAYSDLHKKRYYEICDQQKRLYEQFPFSERDDTLRTKCYDMVNRELPADNFYFPSFRKG